jgi:hypothetical protein
MWSNKKGSRGGEGVCMNIGRRKLHTGMWSKIKEGDRFEDVGLEGGILLKRILKEHG